MWVYVPVLKVNYDYNWFEDGGWPFFNDMNTYWISFNQNHDCNSKESSKEGT